MVSKLNADNYSYWSFHKTRKSQIFSEYSRIILHKYILVNICRFLANMFANTEILYASIIFQLNRRCTYVSLIFIFFVQTITYKERFWKKFIYSFPTRLLLSLTKWLVLDTWFGWFKPFILIKSMLYWDLHLIVEEGGRSTKVFIGKK